MNIDISESQKNTRNLAFNLHNLVTQLTMLQDGQNHCQVVNARHFSQQLHNQCSNNRISQCTEIQTELTQQPFIFIICKCIMWPVCICRVGSIDQLFVNVHHVTERQLNNAQHLATYVKKNTNNSMSNNTVFQNLSLLSFFLNSTILQTMAVIY